jgi:predicted metalloprotease with PDZ domain
VAREFVLVRVLNMRGVNLNVFEFDYDHEWAAVLLNADETIYGRFSGSRADLDDKYLNLDGLRFAMQEALNRHRTLPKGEGKPAEQVVTVEQYPAAQRLRANACIHCHQAYDFRRARDEETGQFRTEDVWVYPPPDNVGLTLEPRQGNRVLSVAPDSPTAKVGVRASDVLRTVNGYAVASFADVQYALHRAPARGAISVSWERDGKAMTATINLPPSWRRSDISWRASTKRIGPDPAIHGEDLSAEEKTALGLAANRLALRQGNFVTTPARQAGIRQNDVIIGVDKLRPEMTAAQFLVHIRLTYQPGDQVVLTVLRAGQWLQVPLTLPRRAPY